MTLQHAKLCAALLLITIAVSLPLAAQSSYLVSRADSYLLAITDKSGLFSFAAHRHAILATQWMAQMNIDANDLTRSSLEITAPLSGLVIDSEEGRRKADLDSGPSASDVKKIQTRMLSPDVLDPARYPAMHFKSVAVERAGSDTLKVTGDFELHGHSHRVTVPVSYKQSSTGGLVFSGRFDFRQTDFGLKPESVAGGTVHVKDEVTIKFQVAMVPQR